MSQPRHHLLKRDTHAVFQPPCVGIVAVLTLQWAAGEKERDPDARPVHARAGLIGMRITIGPITLVVVLLIRRIWREIVTQVVTTSLRKLCRGMGHGVGGGH